MYVYLQTLLFDDSSHVSMHKSEIIVLNSSVNFWIVSVSTVKEVDGAKNRVVGSGFISAARF